MSIYLLWIISSISMLIGWILRAAIERNQVNENDREAF